MYRSEYFKGVQGHIRTNHMDKCQNIVGRLVQRSNEYLTIKDIIPPYCDKHEK